MRSLWFIFVVISLALTGCTSRKVVHVVDSNGAPIQGAKVEAVSPSINSAPNLTNAGGDALLPSNIQGAKWVGVSKTGYEAIQVSLPSQWPLQITLKPASRP
jgi:hypothetical protein